MLTSVDLVTVGAVPFHPWLPNIHDTPSTTPKSQDERRALSGLSSSVNVWRPSARLTAMLANGASPPQRRPIRPRPDGRAPDRGRVGRHQVFAFDREARDLGKQGHVPPDKPGCTRKASPRPTRETR